MDSKNEWPVNFMNRSQLDEPNREIFGFPNNFSIFTFALFHPGWVAWCEEGLGIWDGQEARCVWCPIDAVDYHTCIRGNLLGQKTWLGTNFGLDWHLTIVQGQWLPQKTLYAIALKCAHFFLKPWQDWLFMLSIWQILLIKSPTCDAIYQEQKLQVVWYHFGFVYSWGVFV